MKKYAALLRGINIGGNNKVEMSKLKVVFESLGYKKVSTLLNSGNVVFESASKNSKNISKKIEKAIFDNFNISIRVLVIDEDKISYVCEKALASLKNENGKEPYIAFLLEPIDISPISHIESVVRAEDVFIWNVLLKEWNRDAVYKFTNNPKVGHHITVRNLRTVQKINTLLKK